MTNGMNYSETIRDTERLYSRLFESIVFPKNKF